MKLKFYFSRTYLPLPRTDKPDGPRVILVRGAIYDPKKCTFQEVLKIFFMIMDILLLEDDWFVENLI